MNNQDKQITSFNRLLEIMNQLRNECAWDKEQTMESLRHLTIEETYELSEAILDNDINDKDYLKILKSTLPRIIDMQNPDFIFYLCGVDVIASDKLGKLGMTINGCKERDRFVLQQCKNNSIPVMCSMGGGYSPDIKTILDAHANTFRLAQEIFF